MDTFCPTKVCPSKQCVRPNFLLDKRSSLNKTHIYNVCYRNEGCSELSTCYPHVIHKLSTWELRLPFMRILSFFSGMLSASVRLVSGIFRNIVYFRCYYTSILDKIDIKYYKCSRHEDKQLDPICIAIDLRNTEAHECEIWSLRKCQWHL